MPAETETAEGSAGRKGIGYRAIVPDATLRKLSGTEFGHLSEIAG
jgi:hypothetical protein